jgi:hypothetical protein
MTPTSLEREYTGFDEGSTLIEELAEELSDDEAWDANEETIVVEQADYEEKAYLAVAEAERKKREEQAEVLRETGWAEDAIFLYQKLGLRGFEPLMPREWESDFVMLPKNLFTDHLEETFIKPAFGNDFRGMQPSPDSAALRRSC